MFEKKFILGDIGFLLGACGSFIMIASFFNLNPIFGQPGNAISIIILGMGGFVTGFIQEKRLSNDNSKIALYLNPIIVLLGIFSLIRFLAQ